MKYLLASEAKIISDNSQLNLQRDYVLKQIAYNAKFGMTYLDLNDICHPRIFLFEDDVSFFKNLGYSVEMLPNSKSAIIRWAE